LWATPAPPPPEWVTREPLTSSGWGPSR
jgi:hypothetical protein